MPQAGGALTLERNGGLLRELKSPVKVAAAALDWTKPPDKVSDVQAIWDTGATGSVITQAVVDKLEIHPITMTMVHGVGSQELSPVFLVDFYLPMGVCVRGLNVTLGKLVGADALIGMDVIVTGDFAVTNYGGKTKMSFRVPSLVDIDFVKDSNVQPTNRQQRRAEQRNTAKQRKHRTQ